MSSACFVAGFLISALGLYLRQYWMVVVGYGFVGGIGLGIGYISPVSTLIKWFPDRPGLSTGIAIMGFGGGALIASPLTNQLLTAFGATGDNPDVNGIAQTFLVMGLIYAVFMSVGWLLIRVPADDWKPAGWEPAKQKAGALISTGNVSAPTRSRRRSSGCCGSCSASTSRRASASSSGPHPIYRDFFPDAEHPGRPGGGGRRVRGDAVAGQRAGPDPVVVARRTGRAARTCTGSTWASARCCTWRSR